MNEWMSDKAVYRTAPATPGLLINKLVVSRASHMCPKTQQGHGEPCVIHLSKYRPKPHSEPCVKGNSPKGHKEPHVID